MSPPPRRLRAAILDLDGVIYRGAHVLPGAVEGVAELRARGVKVLFATNNSSRTRSDYQAWLGHFGIPCQVDEIMCSSYGAGLMLRQRNLREVFVLGSPALRRELRALGVRPRRQAPFDAVVVGLDVRFTYRKLADTQAALAGGCPYVATNLDPRFPAEDRLLPGVGSLVRAVSTASGRRPNLVVGKPEPHLYRLLLEAHGLQPAEVAAVGDNVMTDIGAGRRLNMPTVLVLGGVTSPAQAARLSASRRPDAVLPGMGDVPSLDWWPR